MEERGRACTGAGATPAGGVLSLAQPRPTNSLPLSSSKGGQVLPRTALLAPVVPSSASLHQSAAEQDGPHSAYTSLSLEESSCWVTDSPPAR